MTCTHPPEHSLTAGFEYVWLPVGNHLQQRLLKDEQGRPVEIRYCGMCQRNVRADGGTSAAHGPVNQIRESER